MGWPKISAPESARHSAAAKSAPRAISASAWWPMAQAATSRSSDRSRLSGPWRVFIAPLYLSPQLEKSQHDQPLDQVAESRVRISASIVSMPWFDRAMPSMPRHRLAIRRFSPVTRPSRAQKRLSSLSNRTLMPAIPTALPSDRS